MKWKGETKERREKGGTTWKKQKAGGGRAGQEGGVGMGRGARTTGVSFLNLLGVCGSNKDKGGNDYSVKSMVLDCANTN